VIKSGSISAVPGLGRVPTTWDIPGSIPAPVGIPASRPSRFDPGSSLAEVNTTLANSTDHALIVPPVCKGPSTLPPLTGYTTHQFQNLRTTAEGDPTEDQVEDPKTDDMEVEARLVAEGLPPEDHLISLAMAGPRPETEEEEEVEARLTAESLPLTAQAETLGTASGSLIASLISTSFPSGMGMARPSLPTFVKSRNSFACRLRWLRI
jgi:hypothetical protein